MCKSSIIKKKHRHKREYSNQITIKIVIKEDKRKRGTKELQNRQKTSNRMAIVSPHLSIIALKHGLNPPIERDRVDKEGKK